MTTGELTKLTLDELLAGAEGILRRVAERWFNEAALTLLPTTHLLILVDIIQEASGQLFNLPASVLARVAAQWALSATPNVGESRVITELECSTLVVDFCLDAMYEANGLTPRVERGLRLAVIGDALVHLRRFKTRVVDRLTALEGGWALRWLKLLGKPLRLALWVTQFATAILRWAITCFLLVLLLAWVEYCARGGLRRHTLRQDSKRVTIDLPPTRLRRRIP